MDAGEDQKRTRALGCAGRSRCVVGLLARLALGVLAVLGGASQAIEPQTMSETHRRQVAIGEKAIQAPIEREKTRVSVP